MRNYFIKMFSLKEVANFFISYIIVEVITIGIYTIFALSVAPFIMGDIIRAAESDPQKILLLNIGVGIYAFIVFYFLFSIMYLYRNRGRQLEYYKNTKNRAHFVSVIKYYIINYGVPDVFYYSVSAIIVSIFIDETFESGILFWDMNGILHYFLSILLFILMYFVCVVSVIYVWEKKRPKYLTREYDNGEKNEI